MRVTHRMIAQSVTHNIRQNLRSLEAQSVQLSSGHLFTRPSQDPVGIYKVMRISGSGMMPNEQYRRNISEGITWLTVTEDALSEAVEVIQRLKDISLYTSNGSMTKENLEAIAPEIDQIIGNLVGLGNTEAMGLYIFGGHQTQGPPFELNNTGTVPEVDYKGDLGTAQRSIEITPQQSLTINLTGEEVFGTGGKGLFETAINACEALKNYDSEALGGNILQELESHLDRLLQCLAEVGARTGRLNSTENRLKSEHIYLRELRSKLEDIDLAEAITEFTMQRNAYEAALSTGARMIYPSLVDFLR